MFNSIRSRLTAWYVAVLGITLILFSTVLYFFIAQRLYESIDNSLKVSASVVGKTAQTKYAGGTSTGLEYFFEQFLGYGNTNKFYRIYDESGNVGPRSRNIDASQFPLTQTAYANAMNGEETYETFLVGDTHPIRVITLPVLRDGVLVNLVQVGTSLEGVRETLWNLSIFLLTGIPAVLLLTTLVGRFMAQRALTPVARITQTARDIAHGADLSKRIPEPGVQDEIGRLAGTFNEMMDRLAGSFAQMRQFSSDASHELRTPLTVLKGQSELALNRPRTAEEYRQVLASNMEEINYMSKIIEDLFILSKSDEGKVVLNMNPVDLAAIVEEVAKHAGVLAAENEIGIHVDALDPVWVNGDAVRLRQMVWNLLHNGIKYTLRGGEVRVALRESDDHAVLAVRDTGIGIPADELPRIFHRFYRVDKSRSGAERGSGLGLSICQFIVEAHKGAIGVESQVGAGSRFEVRLPKTAAPKPVTA